MRSCSQGKSEERAALICKLAVHTLGRWGLTPLLLLTLGLYCIFPACEIYTALHQELTKSYEVSGTALSDVQMSRILALETVRSATPLITFDAALSLGAYQQKCSVQCVTAQYAAMPFLEGNGFPDESSMPYLILNQWAAEHFLDEEGTQRNTPVHAGDNLMLQMAEECRQAVVCGIFADELETPITYMSCSLAAQVLPASSDFLVTLLHKGDLEQAARMLQKEGVRISYDAAEIARWEMSRGQFVQALLVSLVLLLCSGVLTVREVPFSKEEQYLLQLSGLTQAEVIGSYQLRIAFGVGACLLTALLSGAICSEVSLLSAALCSTAAVLQGTLVVQRNGRQTVNAKRME